MSELRQALIRIAVVLIAISLPCWASITASSVLSEAFDTSATSYTTAGSFSLASGEYGIVYVSNASGSSTPTLSGSCTTWTQILTQTGNSNAFRVTAFRAVGPCSSATLKADYGAASQTRCRIQASKYTGADTSGVNGSSGIVQSKGTQDSVNSGTFAWSTTTSITAGNILIGAAITGSSLAPTVRDYTLLANAGAAGFNTDTGYDATPADNTLNITTGTVRHCGVAIELAVAPSVGPRHKVVIVQ